VLTTGQRNLAAAQRAFGYAIDRILVRASGSTKPVN
jgi:hypothetical protein